MILSIHNLPALDNGDRTEAALQTWLYQHGIPLYESITMIRDAAMQTFYGQARLELSDEDGEKLLADPERSIPVDTFELPDGTAKTTYRTLRIYKYVDNLRVQ